jgi:hypothetical protein
MENHHEIKITPANNIVFGTTVASVWQGIRQLDYNNYMIVGTYAPSTGILYLGPLDGSSESVYNVNYPGATATSVYGPDNLGNGLIRLVGTYKTGNGNIYGFMFSGTVGQLNDPSKYQTINNGQKYTYLHSTMGDLIVGNSDNPIQYGQYNLPLGPGNAFIYNIITKTTDYVIYPKSITNTVYGIWYNGGTSYTICGGYSETPISIDSIYENDRPKPIGHAFLVNYDSKSHKFHNWVTIDYPSSNLLTHFEGISSSQLGQYELSADSIGLNLSPQASWVQIKQHISKHSNRIKLGKFKVKKWVNLNYPGGSTGSTSNSVAGKSIVGIVSVNSNFIPYQAKFIF